MDGFDPRVVSERWAEWRARVDLDEYDQRWVRMEESGRASHGEADLIAALGVGPVLDAGCGMGRVAIELARRGVDVDGVDLDPDLLAYARRNAPHLTWHHDDLATMQLPRRYGVVAMPGNVMIFCHPHQRRAVVHTAVQHLEPGGLLVAGFSLVDNGGLTLAEYDALCAACDLALVERFATWEGAAYADGDYAVSIHRRTDRFTVHDALHEARVSIRRVRAADLAALLAGPNPPVVVDTRTQTDRARFGVIAGSIHVPRTVLEWHLDPANGYRHPQAPSFDQPLVVVCNRGYSSSMGAASLQRIGFTAVSDLVGGMHAWITADLPVEPADHSHLDF